MTTNRSAGFGIIGMAWSGVDNFAARRWATRKGAVSAAGAQALRHLAAEPAA